MKIGKPSIIWRGIIPERRLFIIRKCGGFVWIYMAFRRKSCVLVEYVTLAMESMKAEIVNTRFYSLEWCWVGVCWEFWGEYCCFWNKRYWWAIDEAYWTQSAELDCLCCWHGPWTSQTGIRGQKRANLSSPPATKKCRSQDLEQAQNLRKDLAMLHQNLLLPGCLSELSCLWDYHKLKLKKKKKSFSFLCGLLNMKSWILKK